MAETYTKLLSSITTSTIWMEPAGTRLAWITMLAMADRNGDVFASVPGLADRAKITREELDAALACFLAPDPDSRCKDHEGRRIEEIEGGWRLLGHARIRSLRSTEERREYMRQYMAEKRAKEAVLANPLAKLAMSTEITEISPSAPAPAPKKKKKRSGSAAADTTPPYQEIIDGYNTTMTGLPAVLVLTNKRKLAILKAWKTDDRWREEGFWEALWDAYAAEPFTNGTGPYRNGHENWRPDFDYLIRPETIAKAYEKALSRQEREE